MLLTELRSSCLFKIQDICFDDALALYTNCFWEHLRVMSLQAIWAGIEMSISLVSLYIGITHASLLLLSRLYTYVFVVLHVERLVPHSGRLRWTRRRVADPTMITFQMTSRMLSEHLVPEFTSSTFISVRCTSLFSVRPLLSSPSMTSPCTSCICMKCSHSCVLCPYGGALYYLFDHLFLFSWSFPLLEGC